MDRMGAAGACCCVAAGPQPRTMADRSSTQGIRAAPAKALPDNARASMSGVCLGLVMINPDGVGVH
jgi:hypothetical protein